MAEYTIDSLLKKTVELGASDLHFICGEVPSFRIDGKILKSKLPPVTQEDVIGAINDIVPFAMRDKVFKAYDADFPYEIEGVARFRVNMAMTFGCHSMTIRVVPYEIPTFSQLGLPEKIEKFSHFENGIVLVTGVAGSGKSTTIASILNHINNTYKKHIVTVEDPIEYVYKSNKSIFTQRQIGIDTPHFLDGLKYALRQDPNVIVIGEIRDMETVQSALHAAETGHLVFATLHTFNAIQTINRVLSFFSPAERVMVRSQFAEVFRGTISQKLLPKLDGKGRVAAVEMLFSTPTVKDFIIKDELEQIYKLVQKGGYNDMITFNQSLHSLIKSGTISKDVALENSDAPNELMHLIRGVYSGSEGL